MTVFSEVFTPAQSLYVRTQHGYVLRTVNEYGRVTFTNHREEKINSGFGILQKSANHTYDWVNLLNRNPVFGVQ